MLWRVHAWTEWMQIPGMTVAMHVREGAVNYVGKTLGKGPRKAIVACFLFPWRKAIVLCLLYFIGSVSGFLQRYHILPSKMPEGCSLSLHRAIFIVLSFTDWPCTISLASHSLSRGGMSRVFTTLCLTDWSSGSARGPSWGNAG
jgi:hypothetical protein